MKQVSFYFNLSLEVFNLYTKSRNYAMTIGNLSPLKKVP
jgi:hypothetical protein